MGEYPCALKDKSRLVGYDVITRCPLVGGVVVQLSNMVIGLGICTPAATMGGSEYKYHTQWQFDNVED